MIVCRQRDWTGPASVAIATAAEKVPFPSLNNTDNLFRVGADGVLCRGERGVAQIFQHGNGRARLVGRSEIDVAVTCQVGRDTQPRLVTGRGLYRREKRYRSEPVGGGRKEEDAGEDGCVDGNASTIHA